MTTATIYHNSRCSKSRQTLELLRSRNIDVEIVDYLSSPPDAGELRRILRLLGIRPRALLRSKEDLYRTLGLDDPTLGDDALIQAMVDHPRLIERPIVIIGDKAVIGRPPENILKLL
jgi:arsenate reductase